MRSHAGPHAILAGAELIQGLGPDEMYSGTGDKVPDNLRAAKQDARRKRFQANRAWRCGVCA